jgi:pimeloyl-ACP methyl ester carboxylesterase
LLLNYFAANLDAWDPKITDGFASDREVILLDGAGIGRSGGKTPSTVVAMAEGCYQFCQALGLQSIDIVGFSLGGMIAQQLAFDYLDLVRRMILLSTGPRGGEGMTFTELSTEDLADPAKLLKSAFFTPSEASQAAAEACLARLSLRAAELDTPVSMQAAGAHLNAIRDWGLIRLAAIFSKRSASRSKYSAVSNRPCQMTGLPARSAYSRYQSASSRSLRGSSMALSLVVSVCAAT